MLVRRLAHEIESRLRGGKVRDAGLLADGRPAIAVWSRGETALLCLDLFGTPPLVTLEDGELPIHAEPGFIRSLATTLRGSSVLAVKSRREDRLLRITFGTRSRFGVGDETELYVELVPRFGNAILVKGGVVIAAMKEFSLAENPARAILAGQPYALPPLLRRNHAQGTTLSDDAMLYDPVWIARTDGRITGLSLLPLPEAEPADSLLDTLQRYREGRGARGDHASAQRKRDALARRLDEREKRLRRELESVEQKRRAAEQREAVQREGEAIFATLHDLAPDDRDEAVASAQRLFARYKKLKASIPHLDERTAHLDIALRSVDELRWALEHASDADLIDVEVALDQGERTSGPASPRATRRKRKPLEVRTPTGARIVIGRTPIENADVTFRLARPDDLWFHAQNVPGAHVILQRDDRESPAGDDISLAARYAAGHSKARASGAIPVDYAPRKYVRKQKDAAPGLVWYTHFKTLVVAPERADEG